MRLITQYGELDLPQGLSLSIEKSNPFLSADGDTSLPVTLPSSTRNLAILGHLERIDRSNRYFNKVPAILYAGSVQKEGQLVIDTVHRLNGIEAVFAIDSSDLYVQSKGKSLKAIFSEYNNGAGYKITYGSILAATGEMKAVYNGDDTKDYVIFPVAVSPYETGEGDTKTTVYQYNNEDDGGGFIVFDERAVNNGGETMFVPEGYGIAPFLKLQNLLYRLFEILGYTVKYNVFDSELNNKYVIVHNCADCLCNPTVTLHYADMVPDCTLSEFLEWLLARFMVQPIIDSEAKTVRIEKLQDLLYNAIPLGASGYDKDITDLVEGDLTIQVNPSKRVVLTPTNELEGTQPAADTLDELEASYGPYAPCYESQFTSLQGSSPAFYDCLVLRKSTGIFYLLERDLATGNQKLRKLGTNHFRYDRKNSDEEEEYTQADVLPLMLVDEKTRATAPFIGERIHKHTSFDGVLEDSQQKIIVVQSMTSEHLRYPTTGSSQIEIPGAQMGVTFWLTRSVANNYEMYSSYFSNYNEILRNNLVHIAGKVKYGLREFLALNMSQCKLCQGQRLVPLKARAEISDRIGMTEAEFIKKDTLRGVSDQSLPTINSTPLKWVMTSETDAVTMQNVYDFDFGTASPSEWSLKKIWTNHEGFKDVWWLGTPKTVGETRSVTLNIDIGFDVYQYPAPSSVDQNIHVWRYCKDGVFKDGNFSRALLANEEPVFNQTKTYTFVAQAVS